MRTIYLDYYKARPFLVNRQKYIKKHTTYIYNTFGEIIATKYNAPHCLINVEGSYIEDYNLINAVPYHQRFIVNRFLAEMKHPYITNRQLLEFKWKRADY